MVAGEAAGQAEVVTPEEMAGLGEVEAPVADLPHRGATADLEAEVGAPLVPAVLVDLAAAAVLVDWVAAETAASGAAVELPELAERRGQVALAP